MTQTARFLHHGLANSAQKYPDRPAFKFGKTELSFSEVAHKSNQVSNILLTKGIQKGDRVGILMNRCLETSFAIYGILQVGGVYVPIDTKAPISRIKFIIEDCGIEMLLTTTNQSRVYGPLLQKIVLLDKLPSIESADFTCPWEIEDVDPAYILYTSGSTGTPKGIVHTHKSGFGFAALCVETFKITEQDIIGNHAPIFFDISTLAYFAGPLAGACTIIVSDAHTIMAASMADLIMHEKITFWYSVPLALIQMKSSGKLDSEKMKNLRTILYAGEAFPAKQLRDFMLLLKETKFINLYGPTETNGCTYHEIKQLPTIDDTIPIGNVWDHTEYKIIDGELLIHSITTMQGYWNNQKLTNKVFQEIGGKIFYKTGDIVEIRKDLLYLVGRKDHQIKFRGFRVELGEIEHALLTCEGVKEAVAFPIIHENEIVEIRMAIILDGDIDEKALATYAKHRLPKYAVPSRFFILKDFPRTRTGKIQRSEILKLVS